MERNESSLLKITDADLEPFREEVTGYLKTVQWMPDRSKSRSTDIDLSFLTQAAKGLGVQEEDQLSILKNAIRISNDRIILSNVSNQVLNAVRRGYCIGRYLADLYATSSGLELLQQKNQDGSLHQSELPEFHDKSQTQSAILLFAASSYIVHRVGNIFPDEQSSIQIDFNGIPEIVLNRPSRTIQSSLYYYAAYLERTGIVTSDFHLLKMTSLYFDRCVQEVQMRKEALKYSGPFTANQYKLEKEEFTIQGFESTQSVSVKGMAFNPTRMEDIVANKQAKHLFSRYVDRLLCYDFDARKNPMNELGGLPSITLADGKPGTGKSMLIAATATLLHEKCEQLGYPFLFWPLPENIVSTFQGGTAERAMEWFKPMQDPGKIVFAPIDDAENNLEERTRQGVSAGVREFIGVFLRNTEGAYAVNLGNRMISLFTNIPDQIDKAVLSRIQMRASMEGASSEADFMDQDFLWWRKYNELDSRFIDAAKPNGFEFMDAQKLPSTLSDLVDAEYRFTQTDVKTIFEQVDKHHDRTSHDFFGAFYHEIQQKYPFFSSRDLRNIQKAVDARIIDFDLPSIWWEKPEDFFLKDYASKLAMLKELMKSNMKGVTFTQVRLYEALNYIENAVRINQTGVQREIKEAAKRLYIQDEAMKKCDPEMSMNKLIESGLFGNRLVPVDTPLMVDRYNATLTDIGLPNTRLTAFHIDGWGWSPQIADELGDQFYLSHGLANPYGIIITPEQKEASIYMPYHSFDWDIHQRIFQEYERQISDITTQCGIWFEVDQDVTAYRSPQDLLMVDVFKVRFTTVDRVLEAAREQRALINRFNEEQKAWMDESLRDAIIQSSEQHGDLRFRSIELSDIPFGRYGNFHTLAFNGLYVLRSLPSGKSVLVFADKEAMAKADGEGRSAWDAYHLEDPRLMSVLMAEGLISSNIGYYKDKQFLIHILTGTILRQAIRDDIQHINLPDDPRSRDRVIQGLALKSGKLPDVYFDLERLEKELSRGANPTAGGTLNEKLIHPAESLSAQDKIVIWHLLSNTVLDHVLINYLFDKSGFFRSFSERNETEQDWVVQVILEHRDKFNQIIG